MVRRVGVASGVAIGVAPEPCSLSLSPTPTPTGGGRHGSALRDERRPASRFGVSDQRPLPRPSPPPSPLWCRPFSRASRRLAIASSCLRARVDASRSLRVCAPESGWGGGERSEGEGRGRGRGVRGGGRARARARAAHVGVDDAGAGVVAADVPVRRPREEDVGGLRLRLPPRHRPPPDLLDLGRRAVEEESLLQHRHPRQQRARPRRELLRPQRRLRRAAERRRRRRRRLLRRRLRPLPLPLLRRRLLAAQRRRELLHRERRQRPRARRPRPRLARRRRHPRARSGAIVWRPARIHRSFAADGFASFGSHGAAAARFDAPAPGLRWGLGGGSADEPAAPSPGVETRSITQSAPPVDARCGSAGRARGGAVDGEPGPAAADSSEMRMKTRGVPASDSTTWTSSVSMGAGGASPGAGIRAERCAPPRARGCPRRESRRERAPAAAGPLGRAKPSHRRNFS